MARSSFLIRNSAFITRSDFVVSRLATCCLLHCVTAASDGTFQSFLAMQPAIEFASASKQMLTWISEPASLSIKITSTREQQERAAPFRC